MPIPKPKKSEKQQDFIDRCMGDDVMVKDYPDTKQRYAICQKQWDDKDKKKSGEPEMERRAFAVETAELRAVDDATPKVVGYASKYGTWYPVWDFLERVAAGAFDAVLADAQTDVVASMNHNTDFAFARQSAGTLRLTSNSVGLLYEADVTDQDGQRVYDKVRSGTLKGSSFMFTVAEDKWDFKEGETPKRTITRFEKLYELGPVVWPANADTTAKARAEQVLAEARSLYDSRQSPEPEKPAESAAKEATNSPETPENDETRAENGTKTPEVGPQEAAQLAAQKSKEYQRKYEKLGRLIERNRPKAGVK